MSDTDTESAVTLLARYKAFVISMVRLTAGGPPRTPPEALCAAIEDGTVNMDAVGAMLGGFQFESYTETPKSWPTR
jgi:hypothetical protein